MNRLRRPGGLLPALAAGIAGALVLAAARGSEAAPAGRPASLRAPGIGILSWLQDEGGEETPGGDPFGEGSGRSLTHPSEGELAEPEGAPAPPARFAVGLTAFSLTIPVLGDAGAGDGAPGYAGAFGPGIGAGATGGYRILPALEARADFAYTLFSSKPFDVATLSGTKENEFTDYGVFWFAIGPRFYALPDRPTKRWFDLEPKKAYAGIYPYGGIRFGLLFTGAVDWPTPAPALPYWKSGVTFLFEPYGGVEYRISEFLGGFAEAGLSVLGPPSADSLGGSMSGMNEAGSMTALRFSLGLFLAF
ncbi:MAG: hypothetical protein MUC63_05070 [Planctomycetes bacterium]|jgi:hypothetical protein|nr:hypothetical protein [Planctomycetota bacterium]